MAGAREARVEARHSGVVALPSGLHPTEAASFRIQQHDGASAPHRHCGRPRAQDERSASRAAAGTGRVDRQRPVAAAARAPGGPTYASYRSCRGRGVFQEVEEGGALSGAGAGPASRGGFAPGGVARRLSPLADQRGKTAAEEKEGDSPSRGRRLHLTASAGGKVQRACRTRIKGLMRPLGAEWDQLVLTCMMPPTPRRWLRRRLRPQSLRTCRERGASSPRSEGAIAGERGGWNEWDDANGVARGEAVARRTHF